MGSRVIVVDRDPRPPLASLREGYMHTCWVGGLKMVGVPHCIAWWVGTSRQGRSGVGPMNP